MPSDPEQARGFRATTPAALVPLVPPGFTGRLDRQAAARSKDASGIAAGLRAFLPQRS